MKLLGMFFAACVVLAVLQAAIKAIVVACLGAVLISALVQPLETIVGLGSLLLLGLVLNRPVVGVPLLAALAIVGRTSD